MYMWSFRDEGAFHEKVTNDILTKLVEVTAPRFARITARWNVRGGVFTTVVAEEQPTRTTVPTFAAIENERRKDQFMRKTSGDALARDRPPRKAPRHRGRERWIARRSRPVTRLAVTPAPP